MEVDSKDWVGERFGDLDQAVHGSPRISNPK